MTSKNGTRGSALVSPLTRDAGIDVPLICGAMYPCSNPELVAAASAAGALGVIQPISMEFVHGRKLRDGIRYMRSLTERPFGFNAIVEKSSKVYEDRMRQWVDIALEEGVRFFITALGNPRWVVQKVHGVGGKVYHDVTRRTWADKALAGGVDGLICVNRRAGGHAGDLEPQQLLDELQSTGVPLVCAGGVGSPEAFADALQMGYAGAQLGTRFIASRECSAHADYKDAIVRAREDDIVLTEKISGVPVAVINTPYIERVGTNAGWLAKRLLKNRRGKHWMRTYYALKSIWQLKQANTKGSSYQDFFQAGRSVQGVSEVLSTAEIVETYAAAAARCSTKAG